MGDTPFHKERYQRVIEAYEIIRKEWQEEEERTEGSIKANQGDQRKYINLDDLLNDVEWENQSGSFNMGKKKRGFVRWCFDNPKVVLAAFFMSMGLVYLCR